MSRTSLAGLPAEVAEHVAEELDLDDMRNLRLASNTISTLFSQKHFKAFFSTKSVNISSRTSLYQLRLMTTGSSLARGLQHLRLLADQCEYTQPGTESSQVLAETLHDLRLLLPNQLLERISLDTHEDLRPKPGSDWQRTWTAASHASQTLFNSMQMSGPSIHMLNLFWDSPGSVSIEFFSTVAKIAPPLCFSTLQRLNMSISHSLPGVLDEEKASLELSEQYCRDLCNFIDRCPRLVHLGLHWCSLQSYAQDDTADLMKEQDFLADIASHCALHHLRSVSLKGLLTSEAVLRRLLGKGELRSLEMTWLRLHTGSFRPIFDEAVRKLNNLRLLDLRDKGMIYFNTPDQSSGESTSLIRVGEVACGHIDYHYLTHAQSGEIEHYRWLTQKQIDFGPPLMSERIAQIAVE